MLLLPLLLGVSACHPAAEGPLDGPDCPGPALTSPLGEVPFRVGPLSWRAVEGAERYDVLVGQDPADLLGTAADAASGLTGTTWTPRAALGPGRWTVEVTAQPGGERCRAEVAVAGLTPEPELVATEPLCGRAEDEAATSFAWALAVSGEEVYTTYNAEAGGLCVYDAETLAWKEELGSRGELFRSFGAAAGPDGRVYYSTYPYEGQCGDTLRRVGRLDPVTREVDWIDTGVEAGVSVAVAGARLYETGLAGGSCLDTDSFCLDLGEPCPDGPSGLVSWDLDGRSRRYNRVEEGYPGLAADDARVYRAGLADEVVVLDAADGAPLFAVPIDEGPRGLVRVDLATGAFLLVTDFAQHVHVWALQDPAPSSAEDLVEVQVVTMGDRYWQGGMDELGRFYFPAQNTRTVVRHRLAVP